jgi:hypothetical protein
MELPGLAGWLIILTSSLLFALLIAGLHLAFYGPEDRARHDMYAALLAGEEPPAAAVFWLPLRYAIGATAHGAAFSAGAMAMCAYDHLTLGGQLLLLWCPWLAGGLVIGAAHWLRAQGDRREVAGQRRHDLLRDFDDGTTDRPSGRAAR